jgi:hypothetical protein
MIWQRTSRQGLPLARFIVLALWETHSQHLEAILHLTTALPLGQFMGDS